MSLFPNSGDWGWISTTCSHTILNSFLVYLNVLTWLPAELQSPVSPLGCVHPLVSSITITPLPGRKPACKCREDTSCSILTLKSTILVPCLTKEREEPVCPPWFHLDVASTASGKERPEQSTKKAKEGVKSGILNFQVSRSWQFKGSLSLRPPETLTLRRCSIWELN